MHHDLRHIKRSYTYMALMPVNFLSSQKDFHSLRQIHLKSKKSKERDVAGLIKNPLSLRLMTPAFYYNFFALIVTTTIWYQFASNILHKKTITNSSDLVLLTIFK